MAAASSPGPSGDVPELPYVIRLPRTAYLAVLFLAVGAIPLAFSAGQSQSVREAAGADADTGVTLGPQLLVLLVPIVVAIFIARTATVVSERGLRVRAAFGSKLLPWDSLRGLEVRGRSIYAVQDAGLTRLPCIRLAHLGPLSRMSGGYLPELADAKPKPAVAHRRRR